MRKILPHTFFNRPTLAVAKDLLGKFLVRRVKRGKKHIVGIITEVEAYVGPEDKASHASRGKTERTKVMFGKPGHWYVYLIYGMHHCLNIVTEKENYPAAILIRGIKIITNNQETITKISGPGRICKYFKIDKQFNEKPASKNIGLWIEDREVKINFRLIKHDKRIGVDYAGKCKDKLWRFCI